MHVPLIAAFAGLRGGNLEGQRTGITQKEKHVTMQTGLRPCTNERRKKKKLKNSNLLLPSVGGQGAYDHRGSGLPYAH